MFNDNFQSLGAFLSFLPTLERAADGKTVFLYHGTNCYRRLEMRLQGSICPGRSGLLFLSASLKEAHIYAHVACLRDKFPACNSLLREPVVLKIALREDEWPQIDFVQKDHQGRIVVALAEPLKSSAICDLIFCQHVYQANEIAQSIRSFADGSLKAGISRLRNATSFAQKETQAVRLVLNAGQKAHLAASGKRQPELTAKDELEKLRNLQSKFCRGYDLG